MKQLISLILAIFIIAFFSCDSNQTTEQNNTEASYFPLQVGNEWIYGVLNDTVEIYMKITETINLNNREYYTLAYTSTRGKGKVSEEEKMYLRSPDGLKIYQYENDTETLYRDFSDIITDSSYKEKFTTTYVPYKDLQMGRFNDVKSVREIDFQYDSGFIYYYAKGIGFIGQVWFRGNYYLKYAKVNGKEIGE